MALFPAAVPLLPVLPKYTQDDILALFDRILPDHYLAPLKNPGPGYEYLQAVAAMIARVSEAISHVGSGCYIGSATGGSYARGWVELTRPTAAFGACTLLGRDAAPQGTLVGTSDGYYYQLLNTVTFGEGDLGGYLVEAEAVARGWLWNRPGPFTTADGEEIAGRVDRLIKPVYPANIPNFDPTIEVRQIPWQTDPTISAFQGGSSQMLDGLGNDRGVPRNFAGITVVNVTKTISDPILILSGSVFSTVDGFHYATTQDLSMTGAMGETQPVPVRPLFLNVPANKLPVTQVVSINWGTTVVDYFLLVTSDTPAAETDVDYRARMSLLPSTVTPAAIKALVTKLLNAAVGYRETWDFRYQLAYDAPMNVMLNVANVNVPVSPPYSGNVFVYDHAPADALSNRYLYDVPERGVVVMSLPNATPEVIGAKYPALVSTVEQVKPAGITVLYVLQS